MIVHEWKSTPARKESDEMRLTERIITYLAGVACCCFLWSWR
jgi:hypothetical protein